MATYVRNIAIVGAGGRIGKHFAEGLLKTGKHTVTALTRAGSTSKIAAGVKSVEIDYDNEESLVSALQGQQFLVISLGVRVSEDVNGKLVRAAAKAGVPYVMPNIHGGNPESDGAKDPKYAKFVSGSLKRIKEVEDAGLAWFLLVTGFWYEWSLALGDNWYGIDIKQKKAWFCDEGQNPMNTSTWPRCGEALAALLSLPESGTSPSLSDFKNKPCHIDSFAVTQRKILDSVQKATGTSDTEWDIICEPTEKRFHDGLAEMNRGEVRGFAKALYAMGWSVDSGRYYQDKLENVKLGLETEDLDKVTKEVVDKVLAGWNPRVEW
ncbi:NAD(P)-binding protein [Thozetella sp. PMI_491]|nr:NAD(P)-binding protein [Thozetella sp. PMI_491]